LQRRGGYRLWQPDAVVPIDRHANCGRAGHIGGGARDEQGARGVCAHLFQRQSVGFRARFIGSRRFRRRDGGKYITACGFDRMIGQRVGGIGGDPERDAFFVQNTQNIGRFRPGAQIRPTGDQRIGGVRRDPRRPRGVMDDRFIRAIRARIIGQDKIFPPLRHARLARPGDVAPQRPRIQQGGQQIEDHGVVGVLVCFHAPVIRRRGRFSHASPRLLPGTMLDAHAQERDNVPSLNPAQDIQSPVWSILYQNG
jgi:hypothetical protein